MTAPQTHILLSIARGIFLRDHRDIEGSKTFQLHGLDGAAIETVCADDVHALVDEGFISSNKKFPSATYWLTANGVRAATALGVTPVGLSGS